MERGGAVFNLLDKGTFSALKFQQHSQSQSGLCYLTSYCYKELDILLNFLGKKKQNHYGITGYSMYFL